MKVLRVTFETGETLLVSEDTIPTCITLGGGQIFPKSLQDLAELIVDDAALVRILYFRDAPIGITGEDELEEWQEEEPELVKGDVYRRLKGWESVVILRPGP